MLTLAPGLGLAQVTTRHRRLLLQLRLLLQKAHSRQMAPLRRRHLLQMLVLLPVGAVEEDAGAAGAGDAAARRPARHPLTQRHRRLLRLLCQIPLQQGLVVVTIFQPKLPSIRLTAVRLRYLRSHQLQPLWL